MRPLFEFLFGKPLASWEDRQEKIGPGAGIPVFGLDALSSAAYGPEAALTILIPLGAAGLVYITPITFMIVILLGAVYFSYRQTIAAYPNGGGSYTVAHENLGVRFGLLAAAALMIDYVLNVAVGISAGVGALISAAPSLNPHRLAICLGILGFLTIVNLRGLREAGALFMLPTWFFIGSLGGAIVWGAVKYLLADGHPAPAVAPAPLSNATAAAGAWILLKAFASGCTAMTGVEAVSNGVQAFREKVVDNARLTLTIIVAILMVMLIGIAWLAKIYHVAATPPDSPHYQTVLSQLILAVAGRGVFYYVSIGSILAVLALSANTSFADFPRVCRAVASNRYLPWGFTMRGRRLVYSQGVYVLAFLSALLLILFGGVTDRLIPLFAVGAFLAFTLSQAGMVVHWRKQQSASGLNQLVNGIGALATGVTLSIIVVAKFTEGAWITIIMIPSLVGIMLAVGRHYRRVGQEIASSRPLEVSELDPPIVLVPIFNWDKVSEKAIRFGMTISPDIRVVHVEAETTCSLRQTWQTLVEAPALAGNRKPPELVVLSSPYRFIVAPIVQYALTLEKEVAPRKVAVIIPEIREKHWYHFMLHNQRGTVLTALLMLNADKRIVTINVPWYVES